MFKPKPIYTDETAIRWSDMVQRYIALPERVRGLIEQQTDTGHDAPAAAESGADRR